MPVTLVKSEWSSGNLIFKQTDGTSGDASIQLGESGKGVDLKLWGDTAGAYMLWDQSADALVFNAATIKPSAGINFASNLTAGTGVLNIDGTASYLIDFAATAKGGLTLTADGMSQSPQTVSEDGYIAILVGASIYEIPVYLRT